MYLENELTNKRVKKKKKALEAAMGYLAQRDRTSYEVCEYLKKKEYSKQEIEETVSYLNNLNYLEDTLYAQRYMEYAAGRGKGPVKIKGELLKKGISSEIINELVLEEAAFDKSNERHRALEQVEKIMRNLSDDVTIYEEDDYQMKAYKYKEQQKIKGKIGRRLAGLGYSQDIVFSIINEVFQENK